MPKPFKLGRFDVGLTAGEEVESGEETTATPQRIALIGNWSGSGKSRPRPKIADRKPIPVDRDNFEAVMAKLGVSLSLPFAGADDKSFTLTFSDLDDFHPDHLFRTVPIFETLQDLRHKLENPATFAAAADQVRVW